MLSTDSETILFDERDVRVTPTWLSLGDTSHAIHTLVKVQLSENAVPRGSWTLLFYVSLVLIVLSGFGLRQEHMPSVLGLILLLSSLVLSLTASWFAFVAQDVYRLEVTLNDGSLLTLVHSGKAHMLRMERALREALVMHRGLFREPMLDRHHDMNSLQSEPASVAQIESGKRHTRAARRGRGRRAEGSEGVSSASSTGSRTDSRDAATRRLIAVAAATKLTGSRD